MTEKSDKTTIEKVDEDQPNSGGGHLQKRALMNSLVNQLKQVPAGQSQSAEDLIAKMVVEVALTGETQLLPAKPGERAPIMEFAPNLWFTCLQWIYDRVEGKPIQAVDASIKSSIFFDGMDTMIIDDSIESNKEETYGGNSEMVGDDELHSEAERVPEGTKK